MQASGIGSDLNKAQMILQNLQLANNKPYIAQVTPSDLPSAQ